MKEIRAWLKACGVEGDAALRILELNQQIHRGEIQANRTFGLIDYPNGVSSVVLRTTKIDVTIRDPEIIEWLRSTFDQALGLALQHEEISRIAPAIDEIEDESDSDQ